MKIAALSAPATQEAPIHLPDAQNVQAHIGRSLLSPHQSRQQSGARLPWQRRLRCVRHTDDSGSGALRSIDARSLPDA